jgi:peptidoglycan/xylan/chitin deacetylase (PgdA/CDA1 family)
LFGLFIAFFAGSAAQAGSDVNCPGHPDALGTSRTLVVDPRAHPRIGSMQYPETLPLEDHEVVLTFDDGPLPPYSNEILDTLAAQCVKATFFIVGAMAKTYPEVVRREHEAGDTIGTHSATHPLHFARLPTDRLAEEIEGGIAAVSAALGDRGAVAPFFRIPGLDRSDAVDAALAARSLVVFSVDVVADDWHRHIAPAQIIKRAIARLEKRGRGILLLHDIHPWTVAALQGLLKELKEQGFHVVQVVPAAPATAANPAVASGAAAPRWPQPNRVVVSAADVLLPIADAVSFKIDDAAESGAAEDTRAAEWPSVTEDTISYAAAELAAPRPRDIGISLRGRTLVGPALDVRPHFDLGKPVAHLRIRHVRFHAHRHARRRHGDEGHRAELPFRSSAMAVAAPGVLRLTRSFIVVDAAASCYFS